MTMRSFILLISIMAISQITQAQQVIAGKVSNAYGEHLQGASVFIVGSNESATITDYSGRYLLENVPSGEQTVKVTFLGYEDETIAITMEEDLLLDVVMRNSKFQLEKVEIVANALQDDSPYSYTEKKREEIEFKNMGQDMPFLVEHTPSMVVTSDAGAGIGYTGMRIRGSDATRINVTINGVPLNDSESHGVFWVNMPDFGSSVDKLQIQRGVGPSTNGSGAFGGSLNLNTNYLNQNPFVQGDFSYGSFNTRKLSVSLSTGLMNNMYLIEGRYSLIKSDGFIDRASSDLSSWYLSAARVTEKQSIKINAFAGSEKTYHAWNGVPEAKLNGTDEDLLNHYYNNSNGDYNTVADSINLWESGRSYNAYTYENQVDDYNQSHLQLLYTNLISDDLKLNITGHYTKGKGYFEQFKFEESLMDFLPNDTLQNQLESNLVIRRWLDNHFFGTIVNTEYEVSPNLTATLGGAYNIYLGDHFGEVVIIEEGRVPEDNEYYRSDATKKEFNTFGKVIVGLTDALTVTGDLQYRSVAYETAGIDNDLLLINNRVEGIDTSYVFINPKVGLTYQLSNSQSIYASYASANREPVRSDFLDALGGTVPRAEQLHDIELGYRKSSPSLSYEANVYYMLYKDQLVLSGGINDVGSPLRINVDDSYRMGLELSATIDKDEYFSWSPNLTISRNKISEFYDIVQDVVIENPDISFSPSIVAGSQFTYKFSPRIHASLLSKYVGKQFLDNTGIEGRTLDAYMVHDAQLRYKMGGELVQGLEFKLLVNNILNAKYSSNGYSYSYIWNDLITENYLFPQAGTNFLISASVKF